MSNRRGQISIETINEYVAMVQGKVNTHWKASGWDHAEPPTIRVSFGRRFARVFVDGNNQSVHTFIDMDRGDILKAGSWKAPAKNGVRGNVISDDIGASAVDHHGAIYRR